MNHPEHTFSWQSIGRIVLAGIAIILAWQARDVFVDILIALVLAATLYPLVPILERRLHMPHVLAIFGVFLLLFVPFVIFGIIIAPFIDQGPALLSSLLNALSPLGIIPNSFLHFDFGTYAQTHTSALVASGATVFFTGLSVITVLILTFYFLYDAKRLMGLFFDFFPHAEQDRLKELLEEIAHVTGRYVRGNLLISLICSLVVAAGLFALQIPYAIPLALFVGVIDLLPLVGSTIGAIPAVIIAFSISPTKGILVIVLYLLYQQIESALISPLIYNKALNISTSISFLSVIIGATLFGILGAFLALPVAASIPVLIKYRNDYLKRRGPRHTK